MNIPKARKLPSGSWNIQLRLGSKSISVTEDTERECKRVATLLKAQYKNGIPIDDNAKESKKPVTLRSAIQSYIDDKDVVLSESTLRSYESMQRNRFKDIMDEPISDDTNWQRVINEEAKIVSAKTVKNAWGLAHPALEKAGFTVGDITLPTVVKKESNFLDPYEVAKFVEAVKGTDIELICLLGLHSLRRSEMMVLEKKDIYDGVIHVRGSVIMNRTGNYVKKQANKTELSRRDIPIMIDRLSELVAELPEGKLYHGDPVNNYKKINRFCKKNGFEPVGHHGFRHSFVVLAFYAGLPVYTVQRIGGWKTPNTVNNIYNHISARMETEAYKKIGDTLRSLQSDTPQAFR